MLRLIDEEGKVWEWRGEYRQAHPDEYYLNEATPPRITKSSSVHMEVRAIIHPVPTIHEFGGVKFEETGEKRSVNKGEWFLMNDKIPVAATRDDARIYPILRRYQGE